MQQIVRYGLVGISSNVLAYLCYLGLTAIGLAPRPAMTVVYVIAAAAGFWGNRSLTFGDRGSVLGSAGRYVVAHLVGYATNWTLLTVFVGRLGWPHEWVQAGSIVVVAGLLFLMFRRFVFTDHRRPNGPPDGATFRPSTTREES